MAILPIVRDPLQLLEKSTFQTLRICVKNLQMRKLAVKLAKIRKLEVPLLEK